jgi:hypothetical protein
MPDNPTFPISNFPKIIGPNLEVDETRPKEKRVWTSVWGPGPIRPGQLAYPSSRAGSVQLLVKPTIFLL